MVASPTGSPSRAAPPARWYCRPEPARSPWTASHRARAPRSAPATTASPSGSAAEERPDGTDDQHLEDHTGSAPVMRGRTTMMTAISRRALVTASAGLLFAMTLAGATSAQAQVTL